jgi:hypothetical protein
VASPLAGVRRAEAEAEGPLGGVVAVVGEFLDALGGDGGEYRVAGGGQALEQGKAPGGEHKQARDRGGEVAAGAGAAVQLDQADVAELGLVAQVGKRVLVAPGALHLAGPGEQHSGLPQQIQGDVGQRDVLLELGRAGAPLGEPMGKDQRVVAEHLAVRGHVQSVHIGWYGSVYSGQWIVETRAVGPVLLVVRLGDRLVGVVETHRCGTSSGIS